MHSITYRPEVSASPAPAPVTHLDEERERLRTSEERESKGFIQVPRVLRTHWKKLSAGEWAVLLEVLDRGVSWGHYEPQKITRADFCASSGLSKQAIDDGIRSLVERGVLYAERTGVSQKSAARYAIIDPAHPEPGPSLTPEGTLVVHLLGGLVHPVNPVCLKSRHTPAMPEKQENQCLKSRNSMPKKQAKESLLFRQTKSAEIASGEASEVPQEVIKKVLKERTEEEGSVALASGDLPHGLPPMPASAPPGPTYEALLETLHASAGWKVDAGKDLLLLRHLQAFPMAWLVERAADYAFADGTHSYQGFKNWCQSPRAQEKLRLWEQARRAQAARDVLGSQPRPLSRREQEEEDARIVAERNARSRARFGQRKPEY